MNKLLLAGLLLLTSSAFADATNDAFNNGASFGKGNASQGTGSLKNPGTVTGNIPGYTANPPQSGYYGGVQGGDGGIGDKGQTAIGSNDAGQAIIDSGNKNPPITIDPNAPYITIGKGAEGTAGSVVDGSNSQCTTTSVSKSTFENYTCSADAAVSKTCIRDTTISGHYEDKTTVKTLTFTNNSLAWETNSNQVIASFIMPTDAVLLSGQAVFNTILGYKSQVTFLGSSLTLQAKNAQYTIQTMNISPGKVFTEGQKVSVVMQPDSNRLVSGLLNSFNVGISTLTITLTFQTAESVWVATPSTPSTCASPPGGKKTGSVCSVGAGTRDGVYSDCWQYTDTYLVSENTTGTCGSLISNPACTKALETCSETTDGMCSHKIFTYQCQTVHKSEGLLCGGNYLCKSGECDETNGAGDSGFDTAVAKLAGLASAAEDGKGDTIDIKAFTGNQMSCRKAAAGFSNCCKDSGWGSDAGLQQCNSDELALGKAKQKKVTVYIGEKCDHKVLGVCIQKSAVYCAFGGKLARIIQEQGRRDQLGISFGSGDSPNCSGITVPQLQKINFDKINFADFYDDLMNNQKIPNTDAMVKQVKDRIAAQVNAQSGGK